MAESSTASAQVTDLANRLDQAAKAASTLNQELATTAFLAQSESSTSTPGSSRDSGSKSGESKIFKELQQIRTILAGESSVSLRRQGF